MKVSNINGTSNNSCNCDSWLNHWEKYSDQSIPTFCSENNCTNNPEVGAHVQSEETHDNNWYIIPLCKLHNNKQGGEIEINDAVKLVSANVSNTCG